MPHARFWATVAALSLLGVVAAECTEPANNSQMTARSAGSSRISRLAAQLAGRTDDCVSDNCGGVYVVLGDRTYFMNGGHAIRTDKSFRPERPRAPADEPSRE